MVYLCHMCLCCLPLLSINIFVGIKIHFHIVPKEKMPSIQFLHSKKTLEIELRLPKGLSLFMKTGAYKDNPVFKGII